MDKFTAAILVLLACVGVCMGILITDPFEEELPEEKTVNIEYDVGGATGFNPNPTTVRSGDMVTLKPMAYRDGLSEDEDIEYVFGGWYFEPDFQNIVKTVGQGDVKVYAKWQKDLSGRSITLGFQGSVKDGLLNSYKLNGEQTTTYRYTNDEHAGYYMTTETTTTFDHGFSNHTENNKTSGWNDERGDTLYELGYEVIDTVYGPKKCVVLGNLVEKQWLGLDDAFVYKIVVDSKGLFSSKYIEYQLISSTNIPPITEVDLILCADNGVTVTGSGQYAPESTVEVSANLSPGTNFDGWYDINGNRISTELVMELDVGWDTTTLFAMNDQDPDYTTESFTETVIQLGSGSDNVEWTLFKYGTSYALAHGTGDTLTYTFEETGLFEIFIQGMDYTGYRTLEIVGDVIRTYDWTFEKKDYSVTLNMDYDKVQEYREKLPVNERCLLRGNDTYRFDNDHIREFVTYNDPYVQKLAYELQKLSSGMDDLGKANFVLSFLRNIEYQSDEVYMGTVEYWKFPVETLYDMGGDCEDTSILYCAIVKAMGFDTAVMIFDGHAMSGINVTGSVQGSYVISNENGKTYYYVETTNDEARVGQKPIGIGNPVQMTII